MTGAVAESPVPLRTAADCSEGISMVALMGWVEVGEESRILGGE